MESVRPAGTAALVNVYGPAPPVAVIVTLYGVPIRPAVQWFGLTVMVAALTGTEVAGSRPAATTSKPAGKAQRPRARRKRPARLARAVGWEDQGKSMPQSAALCMPGFPILTKLETRRRSIRRSSRHHRHQHRRVRLTQHHGPGEHHRDQPLRGPGPLGRLGRSRMRWADRRAKTDTSARELAGGGCPGVRPESRYTQRSRIIRTVIVSHDSVSYTAPVVSRSRQERSLAGRRAIQT